MPGVATTSLNALQASGGNIAMHSLSQGARARPQPDSSSGSEGADQQATPSGGTRAPRGGREEVRSDRGPVDQEASPSSDPDAPAHSSPQAEEVELLADALAQTFRQLSTAFNAHFHTDPVGLLLMSPLIQLSAPSLITGTESDITNLAAGCHTEFTLALSELNTHLHMHANGLPSSVPLAPAILLFVTGNETTVDELFEHVVDELQQLQTQFLYFHTHAVNSLVALPTPTQLPLDIHLRVFEAELAARRAVAESE